MTEKIKVEDLDGLNKVHQVMLDLSLPNVPADALKAVGASEGLAFKTALVKIANNDDQMNHSKVYVNGVMSLLTGPAQSLLTSMGYALPYGTLIKIGKECGREFRTQLSAASTKNAEAISWIQKKITEHGSSAPVANRAAASIKAAPATSTSRAEAPRSMPNQTYNNEPDMSCHNNPYPNSKERVGESPEKTDRNFFSMTFYGGKSALCFNATEKDGAFSVNLDAGNKKPGQADGGRAIDWNDKVVFGFSQDELIEFAWVLLGLSPSCEFSGHGPLHDKGFQFKRQDTGYFASCSAKDKGSRAVPMSHAAGFRLMLLVTRQINKNFPDMTVAEITLMLRAMAKPQLKVANG